MDKLRDQLLQQDGLEPAGVTDQELAQFRILLAQEKKRYWKLFFLFSVPVALILVVLASIKSKSPLWNTLGIPSFTFLFVILLIKALWQLPLLTRMRKSQDRILRLKYKFPEHTAKRVKALPLVARSGKCRLIFWPGVLLFSLFAGIPAIALVNVAWWLRYRGGPILQLPLVYWIVGFAIIVALVVRACMIRPPSTLAEVKSPDKKFWIVIGKIVQE